MKWIIWYFVATIFEYLMGTFIAADFDITMYPDWVRVLMVFINVFFICVFILVYFQEKEKKSKGN